MAKSWRTTATGVGTILGGVATVITGIVADPMDFKLIVAGASAIAAGIGLIFAKDANVSNAPSPGEAQNVK